jgi:hypothetical protein
MIASLVRRGPVVYLAYYRFDQVFILQDWRDFEKMLLVQIPCELVRAVAA